MKRTLTFAGRNQKEILRDPLSAAFGLALPILLLLLLSLINRNLPAQAKMELFHPEMLMPGISVFSLSFLALFAALLIAKDRGSSLMLRLFTSPLSGSNFILGYLLPMLPLALLQTLICYLAALPLGLQPSVYLLVLLPVNLPIAAVNISLGMLCGTLFNEKAVGGICGALLTNLSAWLSGIWFSLDLVGGAYEKIAYVLPFANAVDAARAALSGNFDAIWSSLWIVLAWAVGLLGLAIAVFAGKTKIR